MRINIVGAGSAVAGQNLPGRAAQERGGYLIIGGDCVYMNCRLLNAMQLKKQMTEHEGKLNTSLRAPARRCWGKGWQGKSSLFWKSWGPQSRPAEDTKVTNRFNESTSTYRVLLYKS